MSGKKQGHVCTAAVPSGGMTRPVEAGASRPVPAKANGRPKSRRRILGRARRRQNMVSVVIRQHATARRVGRPPTFPVCRSRSGCPDRAASRSGRGPRRRRQQANSGGLSVRSRARTGLALRHFRHSRQRLLITGQRMRADRRATSPEV